MLRREIPTSPPLANRQPTESCSLHVARETVARHHDPYRSHHRSLGRARFLRDESRCRFCGRWRRCCFQLIPSLLKRGVPRLRPLPPGWPRSLITIGSGSFSKQSSACVSLAKSRSFPLADCELVDIRPADIRRPADDGRNRRVDSRLERLVLPVQVDERNFCRRGSNLTLRLARISDRGSPAADSCLGAA